MTPGTIDRLCARILDRSCPWDTYPALANEVRAALDSLTSELDEERTKTALLMQPVPEVHGDFPWQMMRLWCANRDVEKREQRAALEVGSRRITDLERVIREELGCCLECFHALEENSGHEADCPIAIEQGLNLLDLPESEQT